MLCSVACWHSTNRSICGLLLLLLQELATKREAQAACLKHHSVSGQRMYPEYMKLARGRAAGAGVSTPAGLTHWNLQDAFLQYESVCSCVSGVLSTQQTAE